MPTHPITGQKLVEGVNADRRGGKLRPRMPATAEQKAAKTRGAEEEFLGRFRGAISGLTPVSTIAERYGREIGLPGARELTTGLTQQALGFEKRLAGVPEQVRTETRGFQVAAPQLARIQEKRAGEVGKSLVETAREAERAGVRQRGLETQLGERLGYEVAEQERGLRPFTVEAEMISDRLARETTRYTADLQARTSELITKMQQQGALEQAEMRELSQLAIMEQEKIDYQENLRFELAEREKYKRRPGGDIESAIGSYMSRYEPAGTYGQSRPFTPFGGP